MRTIKTYIKGAPFYIASAYSPVATGCWSLCVEKSRESLPGLVGSGRKRRPQIEQAYSPVHMLLPSRLVITALRQIFLAGIVKAYTDFTDSIGEKVSNCLTIKCSSQWNFIGIFVKMFAVCQTICSSFCSVTGV